MEKVYNECIGLFVYPIFPTLIKYAKIRSNQNISFYCKEDFPMDVYERSLELHRKAHGKLRVECKVPLEGADDLSLAYSPGVAQPCLEIQKNYENIYEYTAKGNMVAVVTNGTAVLGLGDIGAGAGLPVMEGKSVLFKSFAGVDAFPICLDTKDPDKLSLIHI